MIGILYGRPFGLMVEPVARSLRDAIQALEGNAVVMTVEALAAGDPRANEIDRVYVLPFDPPEGREPQEYVEQLLPRAQPITSFPVQDVCWDKVATQERLLGRGLPMPDAVISSEPSDVIEFVREHEFGMLKQPRSCGGLGNFVVWVEEGELFADCGSHRYRVQLVGEGNPVLVGDRLAYPAPYYVQRFVSDRGRRAVVQPPQVLRAYIADHQIRFWTERLRDNYTRPSDWIVNINRGARYRFLPDLSDEAKKIALRSVDVLGVRFGVVDLVRTGREGPYVIEVDTDSHQMYIDRSFRQLPEYRDIFDFDHHIAQALVADDEAAAELLRQKETPKPPPLRPPLRLSRRTPPPRNRPR